MRHITTAGMLVAVLALTAACGSDEVAEEATAAETTASESETPTEEPEPEPEGTVIEMTLAGGKVTPAGARVEAAAGEPITFVIDADTAGELHVHSTPESEIAFDAGRSEHELVLDQPGVVEVELHDPPLVVVQLEVR